MENTTTVRFISKYRALKFVKKASYIKEVDGRIIHVPGESVRFQDGAYETSDPAIIEFLQSRPEFGELFQEVPDNIGSLVYRNQALESLEEREARVAAKEKELELQGIKLKKKLTKPELLKVAEEKGVENWERFKKPGTKNADIEKAIQELEADKPEY